jgi:hypothetical protein
LLKTKLVIAGHSHIGALERAYDQAPSPSQSLSLKFLLYRSGSFASEEDGDAGSLLKAEVLSATNEATSDADFVVFCVIGNEHNALGLSLSSALYSYAKNLGGLFKPVVLGYSAWLEVVLPVSGGVKALLLPPPPVEDEDQIRKYLDHLPSDMEGAFIAPAHERLNYWLEQCRATRQVAEKFGIEVIELPSSIFSPTGFLAKDCCGQDPTHGNDEYGRRVLAVVIEHVKKALEPTRRDQQHPYQGLADTAFWRQAMSDIPKELVDPASPPPFVIDLETKVATAGSCFAQHLAKRLRAEGFRFFATETSEEDEYGFSALYGNVYTSRQLLQLFERAFGYFVPKQRHWQRQDGKFCDPFRPRIPREGHETAQAVIQAQDQHLAAVKKMFEELDVFIFTLGLTECWVSKLDGAAYPIAPGVAGGLFVADDYEFANLTVDEVVHDIQLLIRKLRVVNPSARVILTVSPVPLVATAEPRHVLASTTYSKSVLRVAAETLSRRIPSVYYFPSFEIIVGNHSRGAYFSGDLRSVAPEGVEHVMRIFLNRVTAANVAPASAQLSVLGTVEEQSRIQINKMLDAACDEEMLRR